MEDKIEKINLEDIIWIDANMDWLRGIIFEYEKSGKSLGMNYLSMGALRYDEKYFVGYVFDDKNLACPIELVSYIQYEICFNKLTLNYMEVAQKYRGNHIARKTINSFFALKKDYIKELDDDAFVTNISGEGGKAALFDKLHDVFPGTITETNKRNIM